MYTYRLPVYDFYFFLIVQSQKISILTPQKGLEYPSSWRGEGIWKAKKCMKLNWNFPSMWAVWIFSGTTYFV